MEGCSSGQELRQKDERRRRFALDCFVFLSQPLLLPTNTVSVPCGYAHAFSFDRHQGRGRFFLLFSFK